MEKHTENAMLGLKALQRAAAKVSENARKNNYRIPIWKEGHMEFEIPKRLAISKTNDFHKTHSQVSNVIHESYD